jgi:hypothetical protein
MAETRDGGRGTDGGGRGTGTGDGGRTAGDGGPSALDEGERKGAEILSRHEGEVLRLQESGEKARFEGSGVKDGRFSTCNSMVSRDMTVV